MSLKEWKLSYIKNLCLQVMISQGKSKECAGGGNTEQWLFFLKETDGKHLNNSWRSNWFFWLEGLAPFDLSSPEEKLINTEVWGAGCACVHEYSLYACVCAHTAYAHILMWLSDISLIWFFSYSIFSICISICRDTNARTHIHTVKIPL